MLWLDWSKEGWRVFVDRPEYAKTIREVAVLPYDVAFPEGARTLLLTEPPGTIAHGYIELPCSLGDLRRAD